MQKKKSDKPTVDLVDLHNRVSAIVAKSNKIIQKAYSEETTLLWKKGVDTSNAILTKTDKEVDAFLRKSLLKAFPHFGFITEEDETTLLREFNWIIDPIDGTGNFAHNIPLFGTSIALWHGNEPVYGFISFPILGETVHAIKGKGMFLNNKKLNRKAFKKPKPFGSMGLVGSSEDKLKAFESIKEVVGIPNSFHCACFQYAFTALGRMDYSITINLALWDFAAGLLIAKEAGLRAEFVGPKPDIFSDEKAYKYTLIIAEEELAKKLAKALTYFSTA